MYELLIFDAASTELRAEALDTLAMKDKEGFRVVGMSLSQTEKGILVLLLRKGLNA